MIDFKLFIVQYLSKIKANRVIKRDRLTVNYEAKLNSDILKSSKKVILEC